MSVVWAVFRQVKCAARRGPSRLRRSRRDSSHATFSKASRRAWGSKGSNIRAASPAKDAEKNFRALLAATLARFDLVTREEFDVQRDLLARTRERLVALETRVAELESKLGHGG